MTVKPTRNGAIQGVLRGSKKESSRPRRQNDDESPDAAAFDNDWLRRLLDEAQERGQGLWDPQAKWFRASLSGEPCVRSLTFDAAGHRVPFDARTLRIFRVGKAVEEEIVATAAKANVFVEGSDQLQAWHLTDEPAPRRLVSGHTDMLVEHPVSGERFLVEIKSINTRAFGRLAREHGPTLAGKSPLYASHRRYVMQWNAYAWAPEVDARRGCLLFEDKNDQKQKFYWLERDEALMDEARETHQEALGHLPGIAPVPPGFDPQSGEGGCRGCSHRYLCRALTREHGDKAVTYDEARRADAKLRG